VTEPQPVMAQAEQDQLTRQVGRSLLTVAGADWQQVRAEYRSAGRHVEVDVLVKGPDGVERPVRPPQEVVEGFGRLRQGMYRPGRGTWLSALYVLDPPSAFSAEFEPDVEPRWRRVPPPIGFADELRFFPREDEHIPDWLRQRAGLPPAQGGAQEGQGGNQRPGQGSGPNRGPAHHPPGPQTPPPGMPRPQGMPTPPPGIPANPYGGRHDAPRGVPTPPPGIPATPYGGQGAPPPNPPRGATTPQPTPPPGIPAGPFVGGAPRRGEADNQWGPPVR
jgi:hypothetical protein